MALVVAFAVFAWQQGGDGGGDGPLNAIAEAAERTQRESGGRATMHDIVSSPGAESVTITGQIVFNDEGRDRGVLTVPSHRSGHPVEMEAISDGTVAYIHSDQFRALPGGAKWMSLDLSFGQELDTSLPANVDAEGELELLEAVTGRVQRLEREDVRGVPTTRYSGMVSVSEQAERLREEGGEDLPAYIEEKGSPFQIEAWIDADGLLRRMRLVQSQAAEKGKGTTTMDMRMDFFDFGIDPQIDVPDSSEVFDATSLVESKLGVSNED